MEPKEEIKNIAKELFVDEKEILSNMRKIVQLLSGKVQIYEKDGEPFVVSPEKYSNREKIFLITVGIFVSNEAGTNQEPDYDIGYLGKKLGTPTTTLSAPMKNLTDMGVISRNTLGKYSLNKYAYDKIIAMLEGIEKNE